MYKIAVSKQGYNVLTEPNLRNYIFDSSYNTFKIVAVLGGNFVMDKSLMGELSYIVSSSLNYVSVYNGFFKFRDKVYTVGCLLSNKYEEDIYITNISSYSYNNNYYLTINYINGYYDNLVVYYKIYFFEINLFGSGVTSSDDMAMRISKSGYNVLQSPINLDNLVFTSEKNTLKYYTQGSYTLNYDWSQYYGTYNFLGQTFYKHEYIGSISHNLGYCPYFDAYVKKGNYYYKTPFLFVDAGYYYLNQVFVDTSKIYFMSRIFNTYSSGYDSDTFYYKIFKNNLGL